MPARAKLIGQKFNRLEVVGFDHSSNKGKPYWYCRCDCGGENRVTTGNLRSGKVKSCGCLAVEAFSNTITKHGLRYHPLYKVWSNMVQRCTNKKSTNYHRYGGRGIKVCDRWLKSVANFIEDMEDSYSKELELDRKDNDGDYCISNCRFVSNSINQGNKSKGKGTSIYKGVSYYKPTGKWVAKISVRGHQLHIGSFTEEIDAAISYDQYIIDNNIGYTTNKDMGLLNPKEILV